VGKYAVWKSLQDATIPKISGHRQAQTVGTPAKTALFAGRVG
jgi:hypothetical protein